MHNIFNTIDSLAAIVKITDIANLNFKCFRKTFS